MITYVNCDRTLCISPSPTLTDLFRKGCLNVISVWDFCALRTFRLLSILMKFGPDFSITFYFFFSFGLFSDFSSIPYLVYHFFLRDFCMKMMIYIYFPPRYFHWSRSFQFYFLSLYARNTFTFTITIAFSFVHRKDFVLDFFCVEWAVCCCADMHIFHRYYLFLPGCMPCLSLSFNSLNGSMVPFFAIHKM